MTVSSTPPARPRTGPARSAPPRSGPPGRPIFADLDAHFEVEETFAAGDRVVQRWCYRWRDGHIRGVDLFFVRDGSIAEKLAYVKG